MANEISMMMDDDNNISALEWLERELPSDRSDASLVSSMISRGSSQVSIERQSADASLTPKGCTPAAQDKRASILVVDDDYLMLNLYRVLLGETYDVRIAKSGEEAMDWLHSNKPELIVLDYVLPGMDGIQVCGKVRREARFSETRILMVSGHSTLHERLEGYRAGADDFITKPIEHEALLAKVAVSLEWKQAAVAERPGRAAVDYRGLNCWDFRKCGRSDCPAYVQKFGRLCWLVAGTMCAGIVSGSHAAKLKSCADCDFYRNVKGIRG